MVFILSGKRAVVLSIIYVNTYMYMYICISQAVLEDLCRFGERVAKEVDSWGRDCELNPPRLVNFDPWGRRVDHIVTSPAWKRMKTLSAEEGMVAIGYERSFGEWRLGDFLFQLSTCHISVQ